MPDHHKTTRIELWRTADSYIDLEGNEVEGTPTHIATFWGNFKGVNYELTYQSWGAIDKPLFEVTITRGKFSVPRIGDHMRYNGDFYMVKQVNDLTGQVGHDMKLLCELDTSFYQ